MGHKWCEYNRGLNISYVQKDELKNIPLRILVREIADDITISANCRERERERAKNKRFVARRIDAKIENKLNQRQYVILVQELYMCFVRCDYTTSQRDS